MPRHPDPNLEQRILDAAWQLWQDKGERLTLRALARAARTNTPTIYRRFKNRRELLRALTLKLRRDLYEAVASSRTIEEAVDPYLDFSVRHPRQYEVYYAYYAHHYALLRRWLSGGSATAEAKLPVFFWGLKKLTEQLGGSPESHFPLIVTLWALLHGTASLLISRVMEADLERELRQECRKTVRVLIQTAKNS
jgi:AcrR family transcriptional regulator